ncbi:MAG: hypothetical protein BroJett025_03170 [Patescibacteria group bacterium]|nr:MAG: hypothetical protein BroJett025_03170 [Patescibacteria group bacterium]
MRIGTPIFRRYFELKARKPQQKKAPIVYGNHNLLDVVLLLFLSIVIKAENKIINIIAVAVLIVSGAEKIKIDAIAVNTT